MWSHHKYSILARDQNNYKKIGRLVSDRKVSFEQLAMELVKALQLPPNESGIRNALQHMWGYVSEVNNENNNGNIESWSLKKLLTMTQENVKKCNEPYLSKSTALSELMLWL